MRLSVVLFGAPRAENRISQAHRKFIIFIYFFYLFENGNLKKIYLNRNI